MSASFHGDVAPMSTVVTDAESASPAPDPRLIADLVTANRILYDQHVVDAFGHVSVRHDKRPDRFLLARSMAPALVTATGPTLQEAVYRGVYVDVNARLQLEAIGLGAVNYLTEQEGRAAAASNASQIGRAWELWKMRVEGKL
jgi:ribulose-5-phosphate 4-epimerase/fuculose-1-phosphate aldolase